MRLFWPHRDQVSGFAYVQCLSLKLCGYVAVFSIESDQVASFYLLSIAAFESKSCPASNLLASVREKACTKQAVTTVLTYWYINPT